MKKPTARKPARKSARKSARKPANRPYGNGLEIHAHPHLVQIHDADSLTGQALPRYSITSPRNDSIALRIIAGGLAHAFDSVPLKFFDESGNPTV
jgi:hypothetical protein